MSASSFFTRLLCNLIYLPAAILCYLPMRNQLRFSFRRTLLGMGLLLCLWIPSLTLITTALSLNFFKVLPFSLAIFLCIYHWSLKTPFCQSLAIFVLITTQFSALINLSCAFDALCNPSGSIQEYSLKAATFLLGICLLFCAVAAYPIYIYGSWLIDHFHIQSVWYIFCILCGLFLLQFIFMTPKKYSTLYTNHVALFYCMSLPLMVLILSILCIIFYMIVRGMIEISEIRDRNRVLEMEEGQYRKAMHYMEESAKARHDFRHTLGTLSELLEAGDIEQVRAYLASYRTSLPKKEVVHYTDHVALNALLNYYNQAACQCEVNCALSASFPSRFPFQMWIFAI